jgi:hypothetical protein
MKAWSERPAELAYLLNPAFCGLILHEFFHWYQKASDRDVPYALAFLPLPIILPGRTRETLTAHSRHLQSWISANEPVRIELGRMTRDMLPFTREALIFIAQRRLVQFTADGTFHVPARLPGLDEKKMKGETLEMLQAVARLAKLAASAGNPDTIFAQLGLRP